MTEVKREALVTAIGFDPLKDRQRRVDYEAGQRAERARCERIVQAARLSGDVDLRSIIHQIRSGDEPDVDDVDNIDGPFAGDAPQRSASDAFRGTT